MDEVLRSRKSSALLKLLAATGLLGAGIYWCTRQRSQYGSLSGQQSSTKEEGSPKRIASSVIQATYLQA